MITAAIFLDGFIFYEDDREHHQLRRIFKKETNNLLNAVKKPYCINWSTLHKIPSLKLGFSHCSIAKVLRRLTMHKFIGFLLATSISLYSTPLKADSYNSNQDIYADDSAVNSDHGCEVSPQTTDEQPASDDQNAYVQQDASPPATTNDQPPAVEQNTYSDNGNYTDQETLVTPENTDAIKHNRNKYWQNILLAVAVVAVAVTAMLLVNSHEGHKSHH